MKFKIGIRIKQKTRLALKLKRIGFVGMTQTGINRARQLAYDNEINIEDIIVMKNWFARHKYTSKPGYDKWKKDGKPMSFSDRNKYRGAVAWMGWGGNPAFRFVNSKKIEDAIKRYKISKNKKYVPKTLSKKDKEKQIESIFYGKDRPILKSFKSKRSKWTQKADDYFKNDTSLSNMTKVLDVPLKALKEILNKGVGAFYSSGSRPNQSAESWSRSRLYASLGLGSKSRKKDFNIIKKYEIPAIDYKNNKLVNFNNNEFLY